MNNESSQAPDIAQSAITKAAQIKAILFDKDGTLIDFNRTWLPVLQRAAELLATHAGKPGKGEKLMTAGGFISADNTWVPDCLLAAGSNEQIWRFWLDELESPHLANESAIREEYKQVFHLKASGYSPVLEDLDGFLAKLQALGLKLGVATMDDEASAVHTLEHMGCSQHFDFVCGADSGFGLKPESGMIEAFALATGLETDSIMMVGDSPRDLRMGRNAGAAMTVGVLTGATSAEHLRPLADLIYDDISGILDFLAGKNRI